MTEKCTYCRSDLTWIGSLRDGALGCQLCLDMAQGRHPNYLASISEPNSGKPGMLKGGDRYMAELRKLSLGPPPPYFNGTKEIKGKPERETVQFFKVHDPRDDAWCALNWAHLSQHMMGGAAYRLSADKDGQIKLELLGYQDMFL